MKLLHTSDLQLDAPFTFLGDGGQRHRKQLQATFCSILDLAQQGGYSMLLFVGDLFNSNHPLQATVDYVVSMLGGLSIPVCILPGNHDCYDATSIYRRTTFPINVTVFTDEIDEKMFPELDLALYGRAITGKETKDKPLGGLQPRLKARWHVAMAHGNVVTGLVEDPPRPIHLKDIEKCGMDYVALGDWHSYADYSQGGVRAVYCGAPEPMAFDQQGAGSIASVSLSDEGVHIEPIRVGRIRAERIELDISGLNEAEILDLLLKRAGPEEMVEAILSGLPEVGVIVDTERIESHLHAHFYALRVRDQSHPQLGELSVADYPPEHIIGRFIGIMKDGIRAAPDPRSATRFEQALQLGVALLQGKDVL
jgi:exonuclease SbcD